MDWFWTILIAIRALSPAPEDVWATRLAELDEVRSQAFAEAEPALLDDVYVAGSRGRRTDAAAIAAYAERDGRVEGAILRILSCRVVDEGADRARLEIVDQLGPAKVVWADGSSTTLPRDRPTRRLVTLERTGDGWRLLDASLLAPAKSAPSS